MKVHGNQESGYPAEWEQSVGVSSSPPCPLGPGTQPCLLPNQRSPQQSLKQSGDSCWVGSTKHVLAIRVAVGGELSQRCPLMDLCVAQAGGRRAIPRVAFQEAGGQLRTTSRRDTAPCPQHSVGHRSHRTHPSQEGEEMDSSS